MKRGFVLVETIVVVAFLATSLLLIYSSFNSVLISEKRRMYYDDPIYLYRTYYLLDFFQSNNVLNYVQSSLAENDEGNYPLLLEVSCNNTTLFQPGSGVKSFCETLISAGHLEVEHIYFMHEDVRPISKCVGDSSVSCQRHDSLRGLSANAVNYIRTLGGSSGTGYRIVVEYVKEEGGGKKYFYASLVVPLGGLSDEE